MIRSRLIVSFAAVATLLATNAVPAARTIQTQTQTQAQTPQPVTIDVVVLDASGKPVPGLTQDKFQVQDDGARVTTQSFQEVKVAPGKRAVIFVLDDVGVPGPGTVPIQNIARALVSQAEVGDNVSVLHLHGKGQGLENDPPTVLGRIDSYRAGTVPTNRDIPANASAFFADLADKLQALGQQRKAIVCIGSTAVCDISAPGQGVDNLRMSTWNRVLASTARANVAMYVVVPAPTVRLTAFGLSDSTGGDMLAVANNIAPVIDRVWGDASGHYLLTYQPTTTTPRDLYRVEVRVDGRGLRVLSRKFRGR